jgi:hypothetical protein
VTHVNLTGVVEEEFPPSWVELSDIANAVPLKRQIIDLAISLVQIGSSHLLANGKLTGVYRSFKAVPTYIGVGNRIDVAFFYSSELLVPMGLDPHRAEDWGSPITTRTAMKLNLPLSVEIKPVVRVSRYKRAWVV